MDRAAYNAYQRQYQRRRYDERMTEARRILGGVCVKCGTTSDLHIDHIDPDDKTKQLSEMHLWRRDKWLAELGKCQLLCNPCHGRKTVTVDRRGIGAADVPWNKWTEVHHGKPHAYLMYGCRCDECVTAYSEARRRYRRAAA